MDFYFVLRFEGTFSLLQIRRTKVSFLLYKLLFNLDSISVRCIERGDVLELYLVLDALVWTIVVLEYQIPLIILDTKLHVKGMKNICEL